MAKLQPLKMAGAVLMLALALSARGQTPGVTAEMELEQTQYLPDEEMQVKVRISNRSGQTLVLGQGNEWITFSVEGANNFLIPKLGEMPVEHPFELPSGKAMTRHFNPTPYFDFRQPGRYFLGATVRIPQWGGQISCKPVAFNIAAGTSLPGLAGLEFGLPAAPDATNAVPEVRRYSLLKMTSEGDVKLYFRLTDGHGRTLRVFPLDRMLSFSVPEAQMDRFNNLHVLWQTGARAFTYTVLTPDGTLLIRQTHDYTDTRPHLTQNANGNIGVQGGVRRFLASDLPAGEAARQ